MASGGLDFTGFVAVEPKSDCPHVQVSYFNFKYKKMKDITSLSNYRVFKSVYSCMFSQQLMQFLFFILLVPFLMQFLTTPLFSKQRFYRQEKLSVEA